MTLRSSATRVGALVASLAVVAGCSGVGNAGSTGGYVSGDGTVTTVDPADREPAPTLTGTDLEGEPLSTDDYEGQVLVINVWGSWCPPCRAEAPVLKELSELYADSNPGEVQFLGVLNRTKPAAAKAFNDKVGIAYPSFTDEGGSLELRFVDSLPSQAIPTTWVIDQQGQVAARLLDEVSAATLGGVIDDVLAED